MKVLKQNPADGQLLSDGQSSFDNSCRALFLSVSGMRVDVIRSMEEFQAFSHPRVDRSRNRENIAVINVQEHRSEHIGKEGDAESISMRLFIQCT